MADDLEFTDHEISNALGYISLFLNNSVSIFGTLEIQELRDIIKYQQAEINKLRKRFNDFDTYLKLKQEFKDKLVFPEYTGHQIEVKVNNDFKVKKGILDGLKFICTPFNLNIQEKVHVTLNDFEQENHGENNDKQFNK